MEFCCVFFEKRIKIFIFCILVSFGGVFLFFENFFIYIKLEVKKDFNL